MFLRKLSLIFFIQFLYVPIVNAGIDSWTQIGPNGGTIKFINANSDDSIIYAGGKGGVFRSLDNGNTWSSSARYGARSIAVANEIPGLAFIASYSGVLKTLDGGESWDLISPHQNSNGTAIDVKIAPTNNAIVIAAIMNKLAISEDSGSSWKNIEVPFDNISCISIDPRSADHILIGTLGGDVYETFDQGVGWNKIATGFSQVNKIVLDHDDSNIIYLLSSRTYKSNDGGKSWHLYNSCPFPKNIYVSEINKQQIYLTCYEGIYYSEDGGGSWINKSSEDGFPNKVAAAFFSPNSQAISLVGAIDGIYRSNNNGESWSLSSSGYKAISISEIILSENSNIAVGSKTNGFLWSADAGNNWENRNNGLLSRNVTSIGNTPDNLVWYAGTINGEGIFHYSLNQGLDWIRSDSGINNSFINVIKVDKKNPSKIYAGMQYNPWEEENFYTSIDGGLSWQAVDISAGLRDDVTSVFFPDSQSNRVCASLSSFSSIVCSDDGDVWYQVSIDDQNTEISDVIKNPWKDNSLLFAGGAGSDSFVLDIDSPDVWYEDPTKVKPFRNISLITYDNKFGAVYLIGRYNYLDQYKVVRSVNKGETWQEISDFPAKWIEPTELDFDETSQTLYVGTEGGIFAHTRVNQPPKALMSSSSKYNSGEVFYLNGSDSLDTDGVITEYKWMQISGEQVTLENSSNVVSSFVAPSSSEPLEFKLTVVDNEDANASANVVIVKNQIPVANAGKDVVVGVGDFVELIGSSVDTDGEIIDREWTQLSGNSVNLSSSNTNQATFNALWDSGLYEFRFFVTDNDGAIGEDSVRVVVNIAPVARIEQVNGVKSNAAVNLDASGSYDEDGRIVSYNWEQISGAIVLISNSSQTISDFVAPEGEWELVFRVTVTDDNGFVGSNTITIKVTPEVQEDNVQGGGGGGGGGGSIPIIMLLLFVPFVRRIDS